ncbi:thiamine biosynthesis protein ApbE [Caldimicrobium thiodismutans]|uniref:Thiamine biosynthesis protein ApbE n=1 Tax=Caldimicrobium thiodismutans TaxID=1653476 RepID=A0A0U5B3L1_9BACT|nr:UPF0280 family protein [Caldimicrobium thiodismutans]BAU22608.1 thiamine biosynthesis protein ApbE [Caldimicrobium thiodismutans]
MKPEESLKPSWVYSEIPYYRVKVSSSLFRFRVVYKQTDLFVLAEKDLTEETLRLVMEIRRPLEAYILKNPLFLKSLVPLPEDPLAPQIVKKMLLAGKVAGVGPMAGVAGAIAEEVGRALLERGLTGEVAVENGGDIFLSLKKEARVSLFAGDSPFSGKIALLIPQELQPCGLCTSSGKVGHSLSFGKADAITVVHKNTAIADALATAFGNMLKEGKDFKKVSAKAEKIDGLLGVFAILKDRFYALSQKIRIEPLS